MNLSIRSPEELVVSIPHLLGFHPNESLVLVPLAPDLPVVRVDVPSSAREREQAWDSIGEVYARCAQPTSRVAIVTFTTDSDYGDRLSQDFALRLGGVGVATPIRLGASETAWIDFGNQVSGPLSTATRDRIAASTVLNGMAQPAASRTSLADSLVGDRQPITDHLTDARTHAASSSIRAETAFALHRLRAFHTDGKRLPDLTATQLLVALESIPVRDRLWVDMNAQTATSHVALWSDLTRRAPDSLRAAPATMLAFASWLNGNGALAWCALDQVPKDKPYDAAHLVTALVQNGVHPHEWAALTTTAHDVSQRIEALSSTTRTRPDPPAPGI
ncbi:DUF4192 domain-containing protein [Nocardioides gilvus]|uniref:DUF4192 domain-containing protein n=1 Tax=Nocardioides gilvus TaxID=1735589 RepID=UPI000D7507A6|nr:DUF4192 domain-containing protein [Nocardioides gilvus]